MGHLTEMLFCSLLSCVLGRGKPATRGSVKSSGVHGVVNIAYYHPKKDAKGLCNKCRSKMEIAHDSDDPHSRVHAFQIIYIYFFSFLKS